MEATPAYKSVLTGKVGIRVEAEQQRAQLRDQLAQHQAAAAEAQQAAQEASAEAAAARRDDEEEVAEARAALAAREEWVASLQAEASMLQVGVRLCVPLVFKKSSPSSADRSVRDEKQGLTRQI
eukprot:1158835-Pelagomonas_calceolata.AAC.12